MTQRISFLVTFDRPPDYNDSDLRAYIEDAVSRWGGQRHPSDALFNWDGYNLQVKRYRNNHPNRSKRGQ